ncbi:guanitoxin biosynthesis L-enduracididine beta-hydroxylase GntD [Catenulispora pinisilvae]|uniref:guanitoxin biosynthesis L-enduracididine beta-hydroxylase GntD n=1 Tax=Catenulispora pinisilvae TaxID=2705253 RepID=UPI0018919625|nr:guanitoxin biosynthesis L-enduracididine beta-hydroxylase GntD [Catenulispora pinisilvae]
MYAVTLTESELRQIDTVTSSLAAKFDSVNDPVFLRDSTVYAHELPDRLRAELNTFRHEESGGVLSIRGHVIDDTRIGPTPKHWRSQTGRAATLPTEIYFVLCAALLGDVVGWSTQQDGRIMHDILPIKGHENEQLGSGSKELLTWHTEEAFHPLRADYLGLACLRNPDSVATTFASVDDLDLSEDLRDLLGKKRYPIRPDRSHLPQNRGETQHLSAREEALLTRSYEWITNLDSHPEHVSILFGDPAAPYLRIDPYFMEEAYADTESAAAMTGIVDAVDRAIREHILEPGEVLFLDNYKIVHGRVPFTARFDGTDRWLKRLSVARDLRKSRDRRMSHTARVIY